MSAKSITISKTKNGYIAAEGYANAFDISDAYVFGDISAVAEFLEGYFAPPAAPNVMVPAAAVSETLEHAKPELEAPHAA